ncbi:hypothetical protein [Psychrobacter sp. UBA5136]|uniref:hypothetical protein n=1 Tax=Psychrobacter sp. UBA5136 TaxID=1947356 RepID=UPI0025F198C6|nr:hypothetical protein [Psychrobacter sp. UBA5136]
MTNLTTVLSDKSSLGDELACYLQSEVLEIILPNLQAFAASYKAHYKAQKFAYQLPLGQLQLFELVVYLPENTASADIKSVRKTAVKSVLAWHKECLSNKDNLVPIIEVLVFDTQFKSEINNSNNFDYKNFPKRARKRLKHGFTAQYFMEDLNLDKNVDEKHLQIFGWHDWQLILRALHTPCDLWRFLQYRFEHIQDKARDQVSNPKSEEVMVNDFLNSPALFAQAIAIDNALIKCKMQDKPNSALIAMALAQKNHSTTSQMYQQHMAQAAILWSQISNQMLEMVGDTWQKSNEQVSLEIDLCYWQQQILGESMSSRHELIRTLYRHPKQEQQLQQQGYVVHHHSYESLGRHYVLIFYGQDAKGQHSKKTIQPNLAKIALDVATRLPLAELHHVIVLGIDFIAEANDTFIDIDLWIQPVAAMSQRERQLTKKIQQLQQQNLKR